jgi:uncharacterized protein
MSAISKTALALVVVGALNWLLVGIFNWNLVAAIFGEGSFLSRIVYVLVGLCGIYCISLLAAPVGLRSSNVRDIGRAA